MGYTLRGLYDKLGITLAELSRRSGISDVTLASIRDGKSARRSTINTLLRTFSEIYGVELSTDNVSGVIIKDKLARLEAENAESPSDSVVAKPAKTIPEKPQKRAYNRRKDTGLPEGCILATDFAKAHGVEPRTFYDHMVLGLGPGTIPGEQGDPMLPVKEQLDYSERDKPGRKGERERYLTPAQQTAALDFWKRHGVVFTVPESEQEAPADESWWTEPGAE